MNIKCGSQLAVREAKFVAAGDKAGLFWLIEETNGIKRIRRNNCEAFAVVADAADFEQVKYGQSFIWCAGRNGRDHSNDYFDD